MSKQNEILIIGNGRSVLDYTFGTWINSFSMIGRINNFSINKYSKYIGDKTDIWFNGANQNLKKHFLRRSYLYNKLGLSKNLISKSRVLEVGPGSGHNSLYTASCKPLFYDLVEPNKIAIK